MPKITSFTPGQINRIDERVQSTNIVQRGAGAVSRAISNLGAQGADVANQFLLTQKQDQATNYARERSNDKDVERQKIARALQSDMDPATGRLNSRPELSYYQAMEDWENDYDSRVEREAPTDLAARAYGAKSAGSKTRSLVGAELYQYRQLQKFTVDGDTKFVDTGSKEILGVDAELLESTGSSLKGMTTEKIEEIRNRMADGIEASVYDPNQGRKGFENGANSFANAYFESNIKFNNRLAEAIVELQAPVLAEGEELSGDLGDSIAGLAGVPKDQIEQVKTTRDGSVAILLKGKEKRVVGVNPDTGDTFVFPDVQEINFTEPIDIQGEVRGEERLSKYITKADKKRHMLDILRKMNANKRTSNAKLLRDFDNAKVAFADTSADKMRFRPGTPDHADTQVALNLARRLEQSNLPDQTKVDKMVELVGAIAQGEVMDSNTWANPSGASFRIEGVSESVGNLLGEFNKEGLLQDPLLGKRIVSGVKSSLRAAEQQRVRHSIKPEYVYQNDGEARRNFDRFTSAEASGNTALARQELNNLKNKVGARQDQLGLPSYAQTPFTDNYLTSLSSTLNAGIKPESGFTGKNNLASKLQEMREIHGDGFYDLITGLERRGGLHSEIAQVSFYTKNAAGVHAQALALDALISYDTLKGNYENGGGVSKDIVQTADAKLGNFINQLSHSTSTAEKEKQIAAMNKILSGRAFGYPSGSPRERVDRAYNELFKSNFFDYNQGGEGYAFIKQELSNAGVSENLIKGATSYYSDIDNIPNIRNVDLTKFVSNLSGFGPIGDKVAVKNAFRTGAIKVRPMPKGNRIYFRVQDEFGTWSEPLFDKSGEFISVPLKDIPKNINILEESERVNSFFGRLTN